jgi:hypothetical protein
MSIEIVVTCDACGEIAREPLIDGYNVTDVTLAGWGLSADGSETRCPICQAKMLRGLARAER